MSRPVSSVAAPSDRHGDARGPAHSVDAEGYLCVDSKADVERLEAICAAIEKRKLVEPCHFLATDRAQFDEKRREQIARGVPFIEFEVEAEHQGSIHHWHGLAIRRESSLPPSERPWNRKQ